MQLLVATADLVAQVGQLLALDQPPEDEDVKAGWTAFAIFIGLIAAVALLGWALTKQLKRTEANRKAGAFGPVEDESADADSSGSDAGSGEPRS